MTQDDALPRSILDRIGHTADDLTPLGSGFASDAWLVRSADTAAVLRISRYGPDEATTYRSEHAVMARLAATGATVPTPIAGDWQHPGWDLASFSLTTRLEGEPLRPAAHDLAAPLIAAFLRRSHAVPVPGFGPLVEADAVGGRASDPVAGLRERWSGLHAWLVDDVDLAAHPATATHADLLAAAAPFAAAVRSIATDGPMVLVHSDLHEENILHDPRVDDRLGFIDFGEMFVGAAAWEFASIAYFLGWDDADAILRSYLSEADDLDAWRSRSAHLALSFGLSRWEQDRDMAIDGDAYDEAFLRSSLERV